MFAPLPTPIIIDSSAKKNFATAKENIEKIHHMKLMC
jgi:hypothetical protein